MLTAKEFFEKLQSDEAFAKEVAEKAKAKVAAGESDYKAIWNSLAGEYGFELTDEELNAWNESATAELSEEELGKVAGGTTPVPIIVTIGSVVVVATKILTD